MLYLDHMYWLLIRLSNEVEVITYAHDDDKSKIISSHVIPEFPELSTFNQQHNFLGTKQLKKFEPSFASVEKNTWFKLKDAKITSFKKSVSQHSEAKIVWNEYYSVY